MLNNMDTETVFLPRTQNILRNTGKLKYKESFIKGKTWLAN
jgi:hypothetical protein